MKNIERNMKTKITYI